MNRRELFILSITIFLTVAAWVTADILHSKAQEHLKNTVQLPSAKKYDLDENVFTLLELRK